MENTNEDLKSRQRAKQDVEDIETLKKTPAFQRYYQRRIANELKAKADKVLYDSDSKEEAWEALLEFRALYTTAKMLIVDEAACRRMVEDGQKTEDEA